VVVGVVVGVGRACGRGVMVGAGEGWWLEGGVRVGGESVQRATGVHPRTVKLIGNRRRD
jgi:hypothetical protein